MAMETAPADIPSADGKPQIGAATLAVLPEAARAALACEAATSGNIDSLRALVKAGMNMDVGSPYDNRTPLHLAAACGNLAVVRFLVENCQVPLRRDRFGLLPINDAVQNGHADVRQYLQNIKLEWAREKSELKRLSRPRSESTDHAIGHVALSRSEAMEELMGTVFELVVKEGVFSYTTVYAEVSHFFKGLGLHHMYFEQFTAMQIAKHVHCLTAAKRVAQATNDPSKIDFALTTGQSGVFLTTIDGEQALYPTEAQKRTETKVVRHLEKIWSEGGGFSLAFVASEGPLYKQSKEKLGIFTTERRSFDTGRLREDETSLEVLASAPFLKEKSRAAKEQYQIVMEDVVGCGLSIVRAVPGKVYSAEGWVLLFTTLETSGRTYFTEVCQALRFCSMCPRRFYTESFANRAVTYSIFLPTADEKQVHALGRAIMYSTHLKTGHMSTDVIYSSVMQAKISHEVGLYLMAAVKFVYAFFPKEQYAPEYISVHKVLDKDPSSQHKLEGLYKLCMRDLLSNERIFDLVHRHLELAVKFFEDFRSIATGQSKPVFNTQLAETIDKACTDPQDRQIMKMFLNFNSAVLLTNFFKAEASGAQCFRLNPAVVLRDRPAAMYPDVPFGIYLISGRNFIGFHVRFRDVARGGIRIVISRDAIAYDRNAATLFDECYNLAFTQQMKNKDIPEGGSKGVILPDVSYTRGSAGAAATYSPPSPSVQKFCFTKYINSLLDCMLPEQGGLYTGHMEQKEILYFGPDENTANFMDLGAELAKARGYKYWKALTTGKGVKLGGVPHDTYGMTTASVHAYVTGLLKKLDEKEETITKFQTGGPDGDLGSNEILVSKDKTIGIVDGSGVLYDPAGLDRIELVRLARTRSPVKGFSRSLLGPKGFLVTCEQVNVSLPDGSKWSTGTQLRDGFHLTAYATADLFVPCGGRPNSITAENVKNLFVAGGTTCKFRMIVEGANLFLTDGARTILEDAGVHVFKDASTNKGGVCSSSLEVLAALSLSEDDHKALMTYDPDLVTDPPAFYEKYVQQIVAIIGGNAEQEFEAIWDCNQKGKFRKIECTSKLSVKINEMSDCLQRHLKSGMSKEDENRLIRSVIARAVPPLLLEKVGIDGIIQQVPQNYIRALVGAWVASRFVYGYGIDASEVSFFFFLRGLLDDGAGLKSKRPCESSSDEPASAKPRQE